MQTIQDKPTPFTPLAGTMPNQSVFLLTCEVFVNNIMLLPTIVRQLLEERSGIKINQVKGIESLSEIIAEKTGERIGETTLRRLFGFAEDERTPRTSTLDILAHYLDHENWNAMMKSLCPSDSHFMMIKEDSPVSNLPEGSMIEISYFPDRKVTFRAMGAEHRFIVVESVNSKLQAGDIAVIDDILPHFPLYARSITRSGTVLGRYIAGEEYGISSINIL